MQNYKCQECRHSFQNKRREGEENTEWLNWYRKYARNQRTLEDISEELGITKKTLQKKFDQLCVYTGEVFLATENRSVVVIMDATNIGNVGMLTLLRDTKKRNLLWRWSTTEKVEHYRKCLFSLEKLQYSFSAFVIDGRAGVRQMLERIYPRVPIQYCQKHQIEVIKRKIPMKAKTEAGKSLRCLAQRMAESLFLQFSIALEVWFVLYGAFLNEKTYSSDSRSKRKWWYTHKQIRSAYHSLKRNLPYLFTYQKHPNLDIPNTTNICDGYFSHLKDRLNRHRGLSFYRKLSMTNFLLENF